jgi:hypothetical protein
METIEESNEGQKEKDDREGPNVAIPANTNP